MDNTLHTIRETISYVSQYRGMRIVVKLDRKVATEARERGIFADIASIRASGINIIIIHSNPNLDSIQWESVGQVLKRRHMLDKDTIKTYIALGVIPVIYCDEVDGLKSEEVVANIAIDLQAHKLIFVTEVGGVYYPRDHLVRELNLEQVRDILSKKKAVTGSLRDKLQVAINACRRGIDRVHIIPGEEGSIVREIFTCDGMGTMIYSKKPYVEVRKAESSEAHVIAEILRVAIPDSFFALTALVEAIDDFWVLTIDGEPHGCLQLIDNPESKSVEISWLAVVPDDDTDALKSLLHRALNHAILKKRKIVYLDTAKNIPWLPLYPWFFELGFMKSPLPEGEKTPGEANRRYWVCQV